MAELRLATVLGIIGALSISSGFMEPARADSVEKPAVAPAAPPGALLQLKTETDLKLYSPGSAPAGLVTVTREPTVPFLGLSLTQPLLFPAGK